MRHCLNGGGRGKGDAVAVKSSKRQPVLPIAHTARIAFELEVLRGRCCQAAQNLINSRQVNEEELEECARLDDALARSHAILKSIVSSIMLSRIKRRSRRSRAK